MVLHYTYFLYVDVVIRCSAVYNFGVGWVVLFSILNSYWVVIWNEIQRNAWIKSIAVENYTMDRQWIALPWIHDHKPTAVLEALFSLYVCWAQDIFCSVQIKINGSNYYLRMLWFFAMVLVLFGLVWFSLVWFDSTWDLQSNFCLDFRIITVCVRIIEQFDGLKSRNDL